MPGYHTDLNFARTVFATKDQVRFIPMGIPSGPNGRYGFIFVVNQDFEGDSGTNRLSGAN